MRLNTRDDLASSPCTYLDEGETMERTLMNEKNQVENPKECKTRRGDGN